MGAGGPLESFHSNSVPGALSGTSYITSFKIKGGGSRVRSSVFLYQGEEQVQSFALCVYPHEAPGSEVEVGFAFVEKRLPTKVDHCASRGIGAFGSFGYPYGADAIYGGDRGGKGFDPSWNTSGSTFGQYDCGASLTCPDKRGCHPFQRVFEGGGSQGTEGVGTSGGSCSCNSSLCIYYLKSSLHQRSLIDNDTTPLPYGGP